MPILFFEESSSDKKLRELLEKRHLTAPDNPQYLELSRAILNHINIMPVSNQRREELKAMLENSLDEDDYFNNNFLNL